MKLQQAQIEFVVRGDLIEMYKSVNGLDGINWEKNPVINTPTDKVLTRSNGGKDEEF